MKAHPSGSFIFTIEDDKSVRVWNVDNKCEAFQFVSAKDAPTALGAPMKNIFACGFTSGVLKIFDLENIAILYECKSFNLPITQIEFIQNDAYLISMNSQGHMSIHDTYNNFMQIKSIRIDEPTPFTDISLTHDKEYFATIGPEANCVLVWNSKTFGLKNRVPINNFFIKRVCLITKNILAVVLENCSIQYYSIGTYEGLLVKEFPNVHIDKVNELLISKNYKYMLTSGEEGMIKIWDSKMLYRNYMSYQQYIGHSTGVRALIVLEQKSLIITASDNSGIFFWNFLGDLTFCETEITQEFEKLGKLKEIPNKKQVNTMSTIKANNSDKTYRGNEIKAEKRLKINFDNTTDLNVHDLNMLPVNVDDDITLDLSNSMTTEMMKKANTSTQHLLNKIYFSPKFIPATFDSLKNGTINNNTKLSKQFCIGFNIDTISNLIYNKDDRWFVYTINNRIIIEFLEENRSQIILESHLDEISVYIN
jgi:WD40 repeat protein